MMMDQNLLEGKRHIHFIGIGGSGMFPLAEILHSEGFYLTGSDNNETETLQRVRDLGIPVTLGQRAENIEGADLIVHTAAIMADNPELIAARASGVPVLERSELLGLISRRYDNAVCISGTHGKTTTTSMLTQILLGTDIDPTIVIGGKLPALGGSGHAGSSDIMVCEACEFVDTFLKLASDTAVILNVDADHLDYFGTLENVIRSFRKFAEQTTRTVIINGDDANTCKAVEGLDKEIITFGRSPERDYYAAHETKEGGFPAFDLMKGDTCLGHITLSVPGSHNVLNATAAAVTALRLGVPFQLIQSGLAEFRGAGRRFEILGKYNGAVIADDYAHHPAEIKMTLKAAREMGYKRIIAVFQPFTYSRTAMLLNDFAKTLSLADHVVLSEIMGSREKNTYNIYAKDLADKIDGCRWFATFPEIVDYLTGVIGEGDLVITMGCGDIYKAAKLLLSRSEPKA